MYEIVRRGGVEPSLVIRQKCWSELERASYSSKVRLQNREGVVAMPWHCHKDKLLNLKRFGFKTKIRILNVRFKTF